MIRMLEVHRIPYTPSPACIQEQLDRLGINQVEAAELIRVNQRTMRRYMSEKDTPMPFGSFALLRLTKRNDR